MSTRRRFVPAALAGLLAAAIAPTATAQTFTDIVPGGASGINYQRVESTGLQAIMSGIEAQGVITFDDVPAFPMKHKGAPGVALLDYDGDGDLDIYVTNGPGAANSLYSNQLEETGIVSFVDVALAAGVDATAQDSTGTCFGDTDNDGDPDLMVLGQEQSHRFFENNGDGTFTDVTAASDIGGGSLASTSCSMGDVDNDGLLDIVVSNTFPWQNFIPCFVEPFTFDHVNNLYANTGDNTFADVTGPSGITNGGPPNVSWATAMVDYDQDGDMDVMFADDQCAIPPAEYGGIDRGFVRIHQNDGAGNFTDVTFQAGTALHGGWMGLSFADFDHDGTVDFHGSNFGDYLFDVMPMPNQPGDNESRWFFNDGSGGFVDSEGPGFPTTPFGWGTSTADYDNDGDFDIFMHGGLQVGPFLEATNPGVVLNNDGAGNFTYDANALANSGTNHSRREVHGLAMGDLNNDGFPDSVSVAARFSPEPIPLVPLAPLGGPFDATAFFTPVWIPIFVDPMLPPEMFVFAGFPFQQGGLSVEMNDATNGNHWIKINTVGTVGITTGGAVNRDGIGAILSVTPRNGTKSTKPVLGGSSYASQDALETGFGLGSAHKGTIDVLWPGGVRNRLYNVRKDSTVTLPEIPCSIDAGGNLGQHIKCLHKSLKELHAAGVISRREKIKLFVSNIRGFIDERHN